MKRPRSVLGCSLIGNMGVEAMTEHLDPAQSHDAVIIKPGGGRKMGMVVAFALAAIAGAALLNHEDPIYRIVAWICLLAGVIGGPWVWWKYSKGTYQTTVSSAGLQVGDETPTIPWSDIQGFGTHDMGNRQVFTTVQLGDYASWISQLTPGQARRTMRTFKLANATLPVAIAIEVATFRGPADLGIVKDAYDAAQLMDGSEAVRDLISLLAFNRQKYGGEILISAFHRDRSAEDFAKFLEGWRSRAGSGTA
jgi:hypothetical protein